METHPCSICNEPLDEGTLSRSGSSYVGYASNTQMGMLKSLTPITQAHSCPKCGFVEMYLDPKDLKQRVS